jgi:hypothetical protein
MTGIPHSTGQNGMQILNPVPAKILAVSAVPWCSGRNLNDLMNPADMIILCT